MPKGFFERNLQKRSKTEKVKITIKFYILEMRNSIGTKFMLKLTILNFWTK